MKDALHKNFNTKSQSTTIKQRSNKLPSECKICGASALYSYFSVVVCPSCSIFFRRNAQAKQDCFKCPYDSHCEININTRHICTCCRLAKCFTSGMEVHMIRATRTATMNQHKKRLKTQKENSQSEQLPTLSLLENDQSLFGINECNILSNISHCYEESSGRTAVESFLQKQNELPPKMRFRITSVTEFFKPIMSEGQHLYEKNVDFTSLSSHDRTILLHNTVKYVAAIGSCLIGRSTHIFDNLVFYESAETIYGANVLSKVYHSLGILNADSTYVKLVLVLLTFSIFDQTNYTNNTSTNLENGMGISCTKDKYIDLIWRYAVYKCGHERAVMCFSSLITCIFSLNKAFMENIEHTQYKDMIESLIKQTEETLILNE